MLQNFGKKVRLEIYDEVEGIIIDTSGLRVDFDVRLYQGYNRALFTIYNLTAATAREVSTGKRYVRLYVSLHGGAEYLIANDYYVNNAYTEKKVPDSLTRLYCLDRVYSEVTSKQVSFSVKRPTLRRTLEAFKANAAKPVNIKTIDFPDVILDAIPDAPVRTYSGEFSGILDSLGKEYNFNHFIQPQKTIEVCYRPLHHNVKQTGQLDRAVTVLSTDNMRANPIIGVAQLQIESNLDANIRCNSLLDTSNLLTAAQNENEDDLFMVKDYIKSSVSKDTVFSTLSVNHLGSTHTGAWTTKAIAISAAKGTHVNNYNWNL